jgi:hypothetical protein
MRARAFESVPLFHEMMQASVNIRETLEEIANRKIRGSGRALAHDLQYASKQHLCQRDNHPFR